MSLAALAVLLATCTSCTTNQSKQPPAASAQWYMASVYERILLARRQMPVMEMAGQAAARRLTNGGELWVGGSQKDFASEAVGRAGGLMCAKPLDVSKVFRRDIVLYGARGALDYTDLATIAKCKSAGAYVIAFAAKEGSQRTPYGPDLLIDSGDIAGLPTRHGMCPLDTVTNVINLWAFTGELVAACTRAQKMPVIYKSYGLEGGRERAAKYQGQMFHTDFNIQPIRAGALGNAYLDRVTKILTQLEHDDQTQVTQAGKWIASAGWQDSALQWVGHLYPEHMKDPRAPLPFAATAGEGATAPTKPVLIHISYQRPPQELIDRARREHSRLFYCSVLRGEGGVSEYAVYANPHWPIEDGCIEVPGYDVPICPVSGVMQATLYWSVIAEADRVR
jgi:uncharacterized phosphosugar-binding protein